MAKRNKKLKKNIFNPDGHVSYNLTLHCPFGEGIIKGIKYCEKPKKVLVYYPSNSGKGIAIGGTSLRVGFKYIYES